MNVLHMCFTSHAGHHEPLEKFWMYVDSQLSIRCATLIQCGRFDSVFQPTSLPQAPAAMYPVSKQQLFQGRYLWSMSSKGLFCWNCFWLPMLCLMKVDFSFYLSAPKYILAHDTWYYTSNYSCSLQPNCSCYKSHECALKLHCWHFIFSLVLCRKRDRRHGNETQFH